MEDRSMVAVTHLALLGVRKQGAAFRVFIQKKGAVRMGCSFRYVSGPVCIGEEYHSSDVSGADGT